MAELKTQPTDADVHAFVSAIEDESRRADCQAILTLMESVTGASAKMWGTRIVGFGSYHYKYASGREGDWFMVGFSPRKRDLTLYIMNGFSNYEDLLAKLGKHKTGKSCLYLKKLADIDLAVLETLIRGSLDYLDSTYETSRVGKKPG